MKHYYTLLNGKNFRIINNDVETSMGFYTTRYVSANNEEEAELKAVNLLRNDEFLMAAILNKDPDDQPMIYLDTINEVDESQLKEMSGFTWYDMAGDDD